MHIDRRLLKLLRSVRFSFALTILFSILSAVFIIGQAAALSKVINRVFLEHETLAAVLPLLAFYGILSIFRALFQWSQESSASAVASRIKISLRRRISLHLFSLGPSHLKSERTGELSNTLATGVEALDAYFSKFLPQLFLAVLVPVAILLFVFPIDLLTGFVFLFTAPLIPYFMILIGTAAEALNKKQWQRLSFMSAHFLDVLQGLTTLKLFGRSREQIRIIASISDGYRTATMRVLKVAFLSALVLEVLATISIAIVAVEIGLRLLYGKMAFEQALFVLVLAPEFYLPIRLLGTRYHAGMEGMVAAERIFEILDTAPHVQTARDTLPAVISSADIRFENVHYAYSKGERPALAGLNLTIAAQQITVLAGPSGSGKTTVSHLLLHFIRPDSGSIWLGDRDVTLASSDTWREQISWVPQNPYLFHQSIAANIRFAKPKASSDEVIQAARKAHIHDFIVSQPEGYETVVGERGARLSGGQAQRIALARAYLKDAPFLILDEPTANLDPHTETLVFNTIERLMRGRTVLLITHRLNSFRYGDSIAVLANGRIKETGSHDELLKREGLYKRFMQTRRGQV